MHSNSRNDKKVWGKLVKDKIRYPVNTLNMPRCAPTSYTIVGPIECVFYLGMATCKPLPKWSVCLRPQSALDLHIDPHPPNFHHDSKSCQTQSRIRFWSEGLPHTEHPVYTHVNTWAISLQSEIFDFLGKFEILGYGEHRTCILLMRRTKASSQCRI